MSSNISEKLETARGIKEEGNSLFGVGNYKKATKRYLMVFLYTRGLPGMYV